MSSTQLSTDAATIAPGAAAVPARLEVVVLPVADADRAKRFYASIGWREDADFVIREDYRVLQFTPPGSQASIVFGTGVTDAVPGAAGNMVLAVDDIDAARAELIDRGVEVSEVFHDAGGGLGGGFHPGAEGRAAGPDPEGRSYGSYASFRDPDGNGWLLQGITQRLPGRVRPMDVEALAQLMHETAEHHDPYEKASAPHDWWDWYAAYFEARQAGSTQDEASGIAGRYMADVKQVFAR
jgi:catechol 2,3-dioxygenase-like lactoylglutathione lyase family enzyme